MRKDVFNSNPELDGVKGKGKDGVKGKESFAEFELKLYRQAKCR